MNQTLKRWIIALGFLSILVILVVERDLVYQTLGLNPFGEAALWITWVLKTLIWLTLTGMADALIFRRFLLDTLLARSLHGPVPRVLKELTTVLLYTLSVILIVAIVYEREVMGLLAAIGASGVVLGFALRGLIADVFTGLAINIDRSLRLGDWIGVSNGNQQLANGEIVEIGWRCTTLQTEAHYYEVIPNSILGSEKVINYSRPSLPTRFDGTVTVDYSLPTERVRPVIMAALKSLEGARGFVPGREPEVLISKAGDTGTEYLFRYWIYPWQPLSPILAEDVVLTAILHHLHVAGIAVAYPKTDIFHARLPHRHLDIANRTDQLALLSHAQLFHDLETDELNDLAGKMRLRHLEESEALFRKGDSGDSLFILIEGLLDVFEEKDAALRKTPRINRIQPGECFGEMALLTGEARSATIIASTEATIYEIGRDAMMGIIESRPDVSESISRIVAQRELANRLRTEQQSPTRRKEEVENFAQQLLTKMRRFFGVG